jgi:hypothetical protein
MAGCGCSGGVKERVNSSNSNAKMQGARGLLQCLVRGQKFESSSSGLGGIQRNNLKGKKRKGFESKREEATELFWGKGKKR